MFMPFTFDRLAIPDLILIKTKIFPDNRGYFYENFKNSVFLSNKINKQFLQDNISHSRKDVLRGLHYQKNPVSQAKLLSVIRGEIFDVAVDIRKNSPTYGKWISEILSENNHNSLYIPEGFAHGFCVLSDEADILYKVSNEYSPQDECGIIWNDPTLNISWPITNPIISDQDKNLPTIENCENNFLF